MDPARFDTLTKTLSTAGSRRGLLSRLAALPLGAALAGFLGDAPDASAEAGDHGSSHRRHRRKAGHAHRHHSRHDTNRCNKKCGPCKRCKNGACKKTRDGTVCQGDGLCANGQCVKGGSTPPPPPRCDPVVECNPANRGKQCCPTQNPNVQCAGGQNFVNLICQDCTRAPTVEGAFCQATPGNQCCDGKASCFVGVRLDPLHTGQPVCLCNGQCASVIGVTCTTDLQCSSKNALFPICVDATPPCDGCPAADTTYCGKPCGAATCNEQP